MPFTDVAAFASYIVRPAFGFVTESEAYMGDVDRFYLTGIDVPDSLPPSPFQAFIECYSTPHPVLGVHGRAFPILSFEEKRVIAESPESALTQQGWTVESLTSVEVIRLSELANAMQQGSSDDVLAVVCMLYPVIRENVESGSEYVAASYWGFFQSFRQILGVDRFGDDRTLEMCEGYVRGWYERVAGDYVAVSANAQEVDKRPMSISSDAGKVPAESVLTQPAAAPIAAHEERRAKGSGSLSRLWGRYKNGFIAAIVVVLAIAAWMIPAEIPVPGKYLNDIDEHGESAAVTYLGGTNGMAGFRIKSDPKDFNINVKASIPEYVDVDSTGYIATSRGSLDLSGQHQYDYDFVFPKEGNLLQSLLTRFGIWNFNIPFKGHVEGIGEILYTSQEEGFSVSFPDYPEKSTQSESFPGLGVMSIDSFFSFVEGEFTDVDVMDIGKFEPMFQSASYDQILELLLNCLNLSLTQFDDLLIPTTSGYEPYYPDFGSQPCVATIAPFVYRNEDGSEGANVYCYSMCLLANNRIYLIMGVRYTHESAQAALDSFDLVQLGTTVSGRSSELV